MSPSFPPGFPLRTWLSRCVLRFGVHRGKTLGLVPRTVVFPVSCAVLSAPWVMVCAVWGPPRENPGHRPNNRFLCAVPFIPRLISWHYLWLDASLEGAQCHASLSWALCESTTVLPRASGAVLG